MSLRIQIITLKRKRMSSRALLVKTKPDKPWTWTDQGCGGEVIERLLFFSFYLISSRGSTVSHHQMIAVICSQDNPIRTGFGDRNAIKSLKWIGYLRGDKRYTSKPAHWAVIIWMNYFKGGDWNPCSALRVKAPLKKKEKEKKSGFLRGEKCGAVALCRAVIFNGTNYLINLQINCPIILINLLKSLGIGESLSVYDYFRLQNVWGCKLHRWKHIRGSVFVR